MSAFPGADALSYRVDFASHRVVSGGRSSASASLALDFLLGTYGFERLVGLVWRCVLSWAAASRPSGVSGRGGEGVRKGNSAPPQHCSSWPTRALQRDGTAGLRNRSTLVVRSSATLVLESRSGHID